MVNVDVVIISWAKDEYLLDVTKRCLDSLFKSENSIVFHAYVVESNREVNYDEYNKSDGINSCTTVYPEDEKYGYHKFLNFGRKKGNSPWVSLCNNDLVFEKEWFTKILDAYDKNPEIVSFSPLCPKTQPMYGIYPNMGVIEGYEIRKQLSGWCIVHRRDIYDKIGDLDERFTHWFCDNDYSMELFSRGLKHALVTNSIVLHHENNIGKTTEVVVEDQITMYNMTSGSIGIFKEKWNLK